jgi:hypothetical protein
MFFLFTFLCFAADATNVEKDKVEKILADKEKNKILWFDAQKNCYPETQAFAYIHYHCYFNLKEDYEKFRPLLERLMQGKEVSLEEIGDSNFYKLICLLDLGGKLKLANKYSKDWLINMYHERQKAIIKALVENNFDQIKDLLLRVYLSQITMLGEKVNSINFDDGIKIAQNSYLQHFENTLSKPQSLKLYVGNEVEIKHDAQPNVMFPLKSIGYDLKSSLATEVLDVLSDVSVVKNIAPDIAHAPSKGHCCVIF